MRVVREAILNLNRAAAQASSPERELLEQAAHDLSLSLARTERKAAMAHVLGDRDVVIQSTPRTTTASRSRTAALNAEQRNSIVNEKGVASNRSKLNLQGTHYIHETADDFDLDWWL